MVNARLSVSACGNTVKFTCVKSEHDEQPRLVYDEVNILHINVNDDEFDDVEKHLNFDLHLCEFIEKKKINERVYENDCYVFTVGGDLYDIMYAEVKITKKCRLEYVEIEVTP